jgi:cell division protein FtsI (penicillin-binding protein 3)
MSAAILPVAAEDFRRVQAGRAFCVVLALVLAFGAIGAQLVRLALKGQIETRVSMSRPLAETYWRPDILDRHGRLLATDVEAPTLYADPALIVDVDEVAERLSHVLGDLDSSELRRVLGDRTRRFVRLRRGLSPALAQQIHDLGLPGLAFRNEPKRVYPNGVLAGHVLGHVNVDNQGTSGLERYVDETVGVETAQSPLGGNQLPAVETSLDLAVQHGLEQELRGAVERFRAKGAAALILDVNTGEVLAAASLPELDPSRRTQSLDPVRLDKVTGGAFELGSIFKAVTVAMALESGTATLGKVYDVRAPLKVGAYTIRDLHPQGRPLSVREIFIHSSNVGAGMMALELGAARQRDHLARLGLTEPMRSETGPVAPPRLPDHWGRAETITISYGHGIAVAPIQFAAAAATLINGGWRVRPTFRKVEAPNALRERVLRPETSAAVREIMRRNVILPQGTGRRAEVPGYEVGGKTGTAELPGRGGYRGNAVIASFLAAFPMSAPRYLVLVMLHEPEPAEGTGGRITAGVNAAPLAGEIIARVAPLLDVLPHLGTK